MPKLHRPRLTLTLSLGFPLSRLVLCGHCCRRKTRKSYPFWQVPNETFKAAAHLVVSGRKRKYPNVKIVLAHLGGSSPFLAARVAILSKHMGCQLTAEEILEDFRSFYYETALSAHETSLATMDKLVAPDHILFGTDFPGAHSDCSSTYPDFF